MLGGLAAAARWAGGGIGIVLARSQPRPAPAAPGRGRVSLRRGTGVRLIRRVRQVRQRVGERVVHFHLDFGADEFVNAFHFLIRQAVDPLPLLDVALPECGEHFELDLALAAAVAVQAGVAAEDPRHPALAGGLGLAAEVLAGAEHGLGEGGFEHVAAGGGVAAEVVGPVFGDGGTHVLDG
jgi:hypothetical protein